MCHMKAISRATTSDSELQEELLKRSAWFGLHHPRTENLIGDNKATQRAAPYSSTMSCEPSSRKQNKMLWYRRVVHPNFFTFATFEICQLAKHVCSIFLPKNINHPLH